jgi:hypothetical protein
MKAVLDVMHDCSTVHVHGRANTAWLDHDDFNPKTFVGVDPTDLPLDSVWHGGQCDALEHVTSGEIDNNRV